MRLLLDTCVLMDFFLGREPFVHDVRRLFVMRYFRDAELWTSAKSYTDLFYVGSRAHGAAEMQRMIVRALPELKICSIDERDIHAALAEGWEDFEDCVVWQAARKVRADYIVTRNEADFTRSDIPALSPVALLEHAEKDLGLAYEDVTF